MVKFCKEAYICVVSGIWSVVVVICSMFDVLDIRSDHHENFYGVFTKVSTSMLGVVQFMISAKLLSHNSGSRSGNGSARSWYYSYMLVAITMTLIFTFFYVFKEQNYHHTYWGFSFFDMILFFDIAIFFAFAIFHPPPPRAVADSGKPAGRMNVDWIPREIVPERVIVGSGFAKEPTSDEMQIKSTNSNIPYGRMQDEGDSFA